MRNFRHILLAEQKKNAARECKCEWLLCAANLKYHMPEGTLFE